LLPVAAAPNSDGGRTLLCSGQVTLPPPPHTRPHCHADALKMLSTPSKPTAASWGSADEGWGFLGRHATSVSIPSQPSSVPRPPMTALNWYTCYITSYSWLQTAAESLYAALKETRRQAGKQSWRWKPMLSPLSRWY